MKVNDKEVLISKNEEKADVLINDEQISNGYGDIVSTGHGEKAKEDEKEEEKQQSIVEMLREMNWRQRTTVFIAAFINFSSMMCLSIMAPFLPKEGDQKNISQTQVSP